MTDHAQKPATGSERDIYEVANQLGGYVGPDTEKRLAAFLLRESSEAAKLADEIVKHRQVSNYHTCAAAMLETIRDEIGHGYGTGDIEHITSITVARLKDWDRLTRNNGTTSYILTEHLMKTIKEAASVHPTTVEVLINLHKSLNASREVK